MSRIELKQIRKSINNQPILNNLDLVIEEGDFMTLLGPSGCGKTTTLRLISGLENPQSGIITIGDRTVVDCSTHHYVHASKRGLNLVFQNYALWPHMTVYENVAFGLKLHKIPKDAIRTRVEKALDKLKIIHLLDRYPSELSGGQQQRVAIARAIVTEPGILLLDEPLSNLDAKLRLEMRAELKRLHEELNTTIVYVTHDQVEALTMSTKIAVFFEGALVQVDEPHRIYRYPAELRVADFIGNPMLNFIEAVSTYQAGSLRVDSKLGTMQLASRQAYAGKVVLAIYPEDIKVVSEPVEGGISCTISSVLPAGAETLVQLVTSQGLDMLMKATGENEFRKGDQVWMTLALAKVNIYEKETGRLIART